MLTNEYIDKVISQYLDRNYTEKMGERSRELTKQLSSSPMIQKLALSSASRYSINTSSALSILIGGIILGMDLEAMQKN